MPIPSKLEKNYINLLLSLAFGIAWAFFWAVDSTLAYLLFGSASFFLALFFYNQRTKEVETNGFGSKLDKHLSSTSFTKPQENYTSPPDQKRPKSVQLVFSMVVVSLFFAVLVLTRFAKQTPTVDFDVLIELADQKYNDGDYDSARYYYRLILKEKEDKEEAWLGLGNILYMQDKKDSALILYQKALAINSDYTQARYNIGWWYYKQKQYRESIVQLKTLVADDPLQLDAMQLVGDNFYELTEYDSAIHWYENAYGNGARSRWLCHVMAYIYDKNNVVEKAIPLYKEALQYDSSIVDIYIRLGELLPPGEGEVYRFKAAQWQLR